MVCWAILAQETRAGGKKMSDSNTMPIKMVATRDHLPAAAPASSGVDCLRPFANERLNSRLASALPHGDWKIRWTASLPSSGLFTAILHSGERTLITGRAEWRLFDKAGHQLAADVTTGDDAEIDPAHGLFYIPNRYGNLAAYRLADGHADYRFPVEGTPDYSRTLVHRFDNKFAVASSKRSVNPMNPTPVRISALEMHELTEPRRMDQDLLTSEHQIAIRQYEASRLYTAFHGNLLAVTALTNVLEYLDPALIVKRNYSGTFEPQALSLDETGRVYMLVQNALWLVSHRGEVLEVKLDSPVLPLPPIVGHNHAIYLVGVNQVTAITEGGKIAWHFSSTTGRIAGAMITGDDQLLTAAGSAVVILNPTTGAPTVLHDFGKEVIIAPPVLTSGGELMVATVNHLYALSH